MISSNDIGVWTRRASLFPVRQPLTIMAATVKFAPVLAVGILGNPRKLLQFRYKTGAGAMVSLVSETHFVIDSR